MAFQDCTLLPIPLALTVVMAVMTTLKLGKKFFSNYSLPNDVVMADNMNLFKKRLDKFWSS